MTRFQFAIPENFDFSKPQGLNKWYQRFQRFRSASGLVEKPDKTQVKSLIYCMDSRHFGFVKT